MATLHCICDQQAKLGESPRWHPAERKVYWTDIDGKRLWRCGPDGNDAQSVDLSQKAGCLVFRDKGGLVLAMEDGIYAGDPFAGEKDLEQLCPHPDMELAAQGGRFNDGRCDPMGRFYVGTLDPKKEGRAALYVLEPGERTACMVQEGFSTFNGIAFHPNGNEIWYSDTPGYKLYCSSYDAKTGTVGERELVKEWDRSKSARPDGAGFDTDGDYWCALYAGGCVQRINGHGEVKEEHALPATYTTMATFVGDGLDKIVVTSGLREDDPDETTRNPQAGCLFLLDGVGKTGIKECSYKG